MIFDATLDLILRGSDNNKLFFLMFSSCEIFLLDEIIKDLKNYELELRILDLESKFSKDFSETTFNEIKELKKSQKLN